jgi:cytochrome c553
MRTRLSVLVVAVLAVTSTGLYSQQQPTAPASALPSPPQREPAWAFPVQAGALPAESPEPKSVEGSTKKYTPQEIDNLLAPPDWFPDAHKPAPSIVQKGHGAALAGISKEVSDEEARQAAEWFASLPRNKWSRVVEAAMVPKTFVGQGRMRFLDPKDKSMEPIGKRIITLPENQELARLRDPRSGFVSYVPPGSLSKGKSLVEGGAKSKTIACDICHGDGLKGLANVPRIAGLHPIYIARQLHLFKEGDRNGPDAALMKKPVVQLTDDDILNISAYVGSLSPQ